MITLKNKKRQELLNLYQLEIYNKPEKIYIPLNYTNMIILVKNGDYVFKGSIVAKIKGDEKKYVFSSVSGKVIGFEEKIIYDSNKVNCIVIENDFKEKMENRVNNNINTKEEFIQRLQNCGIEENKFITYLKDINGIKVKTLIINTFEYDSYINTNCTLLIQNIEQILETIDMILEICDINNATIVLSKDNKILLDIINNYIGTYLKIKVIIVPNSYFEFCGKKFIKKIIGINYTKLSIEKGIIVENVFSIYNIYNAVILNRPFTEQLISFITDKENISYLIKLGTPIKELINNKGEVYVNGEVITNDVLNDLIITPQLKSVLIKKNNGQNKNKQ